MSKLTVEHVRDGLAQLKAGNKGRSARLANGWLLCLYRNFSGSRARWEISTHVGPFGFTWSVKPEYLAVKRGRCPYGSGNSYTIEPGILDAMAAKLLPRLAAIEADYMPRAAMFRSMPLERVRYRLLHADDIVDTEGWQVLVDGCWHSLPMLDERDDVCSLIERCEALGREHFLAPSHAGRGLSTVDIEGMVAA